MEFNDQVVSVVYPHAAIAENFGGHVTEGLYDKARKRLCTSTRQKNQTAYMLVYVKSQTLLDVFLDIKDNSHPEWIAKLQSDEQARRRQKEERSKFLMLSLAEYSDDCLATKGIFYAKPYFNSKISSEIKSQKRYSLDRSRTFEDALTDLDFRRDDMANLFLYRVHFLATHTILAEQLMPISIYKSSFCRALADNLDIQQQQFYLARFPTLNV